MGNTGRPSTGCARCRKRRIKCDERRPQCYRCEKLGEECPGYTHSFWIFRDENDTAKRRALRNVRGKDSASAVTIAEDENFSTTVVKKSRDQSLPSSDADLVQTVTAYKAKGRLPTTIQPALDVDFEFRSICLFMETFTLDASTEGDDPAFLDFLPGLYVDSTADPSLRKAVKAVALSNFANRYHATDIASNALVAYGDALSALSKALRNPATATSDSVLAASYLLGLYELLCHPKITPIGSAGWSNHILGILQLVQFRWSKQLKMGKARYLFHTVHEPILIGLMMAYEPPPTESMKFILAQEYPEGLGAKIALVFFCKAIDVRAKLQRGGYIEIPTTKDKAQHLIKIIDEADALLRSQSFENWVANEPHWHALSFQPPSSVKTGKYAFSSQTIAGYWVHHWNVQICLQKSIIDGLVALEASGFRNEEESTQSRARMSSLKEGIESKAEQILGAVDYCLNGFHQLQAPDHGIFDSDRSQGTVVSSVGALRLFWPLGTIRHIPFSNSLQKDIATAVLRKIGTEMSVAQALLHIA